jgi:hypothetical protein
MNCWASEDAGHVLMFLRRAATDETVVPAAFLRAGEGR